MRIHYLSINCTKLTFANLHYHHHHALHAFRYYSAFAPLHSLPYIRSSTYTRYCYPGRGGTQGPLQILHAQGQPLLHLPPDIARGECAQEECGGLRGGGRGLTSGGVSLRTALLQVRADRAVRRITTSQTLLTSSSSSSFSSSSCRYTDPSRESRKSMAAIMVIDCTINRMYPLML
jgi:hypothetical protein